MSLPEFSIKKRVTIYMFTAGLLLLGFLAFKKLPQELFPPITFPQITIVTDYSNAAPEEIAFKLPMMNEYKNWQQVLNTTDNAPTTLTFAAGAEMKAPPRSVLAFAGAT